jgi:type IV secretory pathway VirB2 component (pilin)
MIAPGAAQLESLIDPPPASVVGPATSWVSDLLFGPLASAIAVIAIAWIGFAMLSGRIEIRRGLSVAFGCFLLFGARAIADELRSITGGNDPTSIAAAPLPPVYSAAPLSRRHTNAFDPYAGSPKKRP